MKEYLAHISGERKQTVEDHLIGTAKLASKFADAFDAGDFGYLAGMAHDIGKYSEGFQKRLMGGPKVDHSSAGAIECSAIGKELIGICVAGHHGGLPDFGNTSSDMAGDPTFIGRIKKRITGRSIDYPGWKGPLPSAGEMPEMNGFYRSLWTRMLFSCLVDADFIDTETFMTGNEKERGGYDTLPVLLKKLQSFVKRFGEPKTEINKIRNEIFRDCVSASQFPKGLYSLTVPTGGGKTISSLAFALEHAVKHSMDRVIYVIPYTSIIEQNAEVFRSILGDENIVEHHSNVDTDENDEDELLKTKKMMATENWDAPIIVTTAVQFFESLFSNKTSKCRKLHNIANSVVVFDEVQMMPTGHLLPCSAVIGTLVAHFGVTAVLCTATQPFISDLLSQFDGGMEIKEISKKKKESFDLLRRVKYSVVGKISDEELALRLGENNQVLCIVNSRKMAKRIYDLLPADGSYHLSTLMTPDLRAKTLGEIRRKLIAGEKCRVVSTSLIEAGVDVDFPKVYREISGLDSIVQAAGRCNREGKRPLSDSVVTVFELDNKIPPLLKINIGATKEVAGVVSEFGSPDATDEYFRAYRSLMGDGIDKTKAVDHLSKGICGCFLPFETVAKSFHFIDDNTKTVYIPSDENAELIERLVSGETDRQLFRKLGKYAVNIYENHYNALLAFGDIKEIMPGAAILINRQIYDIHTGLSLNADEGKGLFV